MSLTGQTSRTRSWKSWDGVGVGVGVGGRRALAGGHEDNPAATNSPRPERRQLRRVLQTLARKLGRSAEVSIARSRVEAGGRT